jgi:hypothetical protein
VRKIKEVHRLKFEVGLGLADRPQLLGWSRHLWVINIGSRVSRRFRPVVTMMKTPKARSGHNAGPKWRTVLDCSSGRCVLVQANMSPVLMVVGKVVTPKPPKVIFV